MKKQITHLKDDEHSTQESESPDFAKLQGINLVLCIIIQCMYTRPSMYICIVLGC